METSTTIATPQIDKICTKCGREGHWAQEHDICYLDE